MTLKILVLVALPLLVWSVIVLLSLPRLLETEQDRKKVVEQATEPPPLFVRDYTGQLWVEKDRKGFFRTIRRRGPPADQSDE